MASQGRTGAMPRLRLDKVALRLVQDVRSALEGAVPEGVCAVFTVTAPIRERSKTTAAIIEIIRAQLLLGAGSAEHAEALHGNKVLARVVESRLPNAARVAGFVHNPDPPPTVLFEIAQSLLNNVETPDLAEGNDTACEPDRLREVRSQLFDVVGRQQITAFCNPRQTRSSRG